MFYKGGDNMTTQMMTIKEVAEVLRLHEVTVQNMAIAGRIPAVKIGKCWKFRADVIEKITLEGLPEVKKAGE
jgi:excisionase family DNA binding protein